MTAALRLRLEVPLDEFHLRIDCTAGERVVGLFGPSGSGKTTCLESIAGLRPGATGRVASGDAVWLDSERGVNVPAQERGIGYVPQDLLLFPHRDVRWNLRAGCRRALRGGHDVDAVYAEVVDVLQLEPLLGRPVGGLSGGERQRVALGRALCSGPALLLLDEPLASLDIRLRHRILPFLIRVRDRFRIPMLVVSHDPFELQALCGEVVALRRGRVVAQGTPTDVFTRPEIYGGAAGEGFENVLPARVVGHDAHTTRAALGSAGSGPEIVLLRVEAAIGAAVVLGVPAQDILVASRPITGISARNCLPATVRWLEEVDHKRVVTALVDGAEDTPVVVELTADAVRELTVTPGSRIWLLMKSSSVAFYG